MSTRWFAAALLFALGFATAMLVRLPAAAAASTVMTVEGLLDLVDGDKLQLVYHQGGEDDYLVVTSRKLPPGTISNPQVSYQTGSATFSKHDLYSLLILRLTPVAVWNGELWRCDDAPVLCALPPRPPQPIDPSQQRLDYMFMQSAP